MEQLARIVAGRDGWQRRNEGDLNFPPLYAHFSQVPVPSSVLPATSQIFRLSLENSHSGLSFSASRRRLAPFNSRFPPPCLTPPLNIMIAINLRYLETQRQFQMHTGRPPQNTPQAASRFSGETDKSPRC